MLAAHNARRRKRGEAEVTVADLEHARHGGRPRAETQSEAYLAERELDQLLEATNARRRARGLPERTPRGRASASLARGSDARVTATTADGWLAA